MPFLYKFFLGLGFISLTTSASYAANELPKKEQREIYEQSQRLLDNNHIDQYYLLRPHIAHYTLTPYLDYRVFLAELSERSPQEVEQFMKDYRKFPFSNRIRGAYLDALVEKEDWARFAEFQQELPRMESYRCSYYYAQLQNEQQQSAFEGAESLWLSGNSVSGRCDELFEQWHIAGLRSDDLILQRMLLAYEKRNTSLLTYLAKMPSSDSAKKLAVWMVTLDKNPEQIISFVERYPATEFNQKVAALSVKKIARSDAQLAIDTLEQLDFDNQTSQQLADYIAYQLINTDNEVLAQWRDIALSHSDNVSWLERRVRLAIQQADWKGIGYWIARLPESKQDDRRWQYWMARAEIETGHTQRGEQRLKTLLGARSFYSAAAAYHLDVPIEYYSAVTEVNLDDVKRYESTLERIEELIELDKIAAAKSEWRWLLTRAYNEDKQTLAYYASQKRWHNLTVTATIEGRMWEHTALRFPVAHQWWFDFYAKQNEMDPITLMALARQESAMDIQARSPVGARGLMQIMPTTAQYTAKKYDINYAGAEELYDVGKNIEIGSHYLKGLLNQYDDNRIFAFAAYNAGPNRVRSWRERSNENIDVFSFIEAIPFKETRGYVQNVLMFETYYRNLMNESGPFLTPSEATLRY